MRDFNLEEAINGAPLVLRCGTPINRVLTFDLADDHHQIVATYVETEGVNKGREVVALFNKHGHDPHTGLSLYISVPKIKLWRRLLLGYNGDYAYIVSTCEPDVDTPLAPDCQWINDWESFEVEQ